MDEDVEEFDAAPFRAREAEVIAIFAHHLSVLRPDEVQRLKDCGAVLINFDALEAGHEFTLQDLAISFVDDGESVIDVERRIGKQWISSFGWLQELRATEGPTVNPSRLRYQDVLMQVVSFDWFELVIWDLEDRWLNGSG